MTKHFDSFIFPFAIYIQKSKNYSLSKKYTTLKSHSKEMSLDALPISSSPIANIVLILNPGDKRFC